MKHLVGRLKNLFLGNAINQTTQNKQLLGERDLALVKGRKDILKELQHCKNSGNIVGVYSSSLGEGMFVTGVEDVYQGEREAVVVFKPYDIGGNILVRNYLSINEIRSVCSLEYSYRNPFVQSDKLTGVKVN